MIIHHAVPGIVGDNLKFLFHNSIKTSSFNFWDTQNCTVNILRWRTLPKQSFDTETQGLPLHLAKLRVLYLFLPFPTNMRTAPNIIITGTPGVGKTIHSEQVAQDTGLQHLSINDVAKQRDCYDGYDEERQSWIIDEDKVWFDPASLV